MCQRKISCCILGDSISQGVGKKRINYIPFLESRSNGCISFINMAQTGTTIKYVDEIISDIEAKHPDIIVVMYGSVEAQIRANIWRNRGGLCNIIPNRYKGGGMLEPRAVYSKKWYRFVPDRIDTINRFFIKKYVLFTQGKVQWITKDEFGILYREKIKKLSDITKNLILISTVYIDDHYFLNSSKEYELFNKIISNVAKENNLRFLDIYSPMRYSVKTRGWDHYYLKDHFHPNVNGYEFIASKIWHIIKESMRIDG